MKRVLTLLFIIFALLGCGKDADVSAVSEIYFNANTIYMKSGSDTTLTVCHYPSSIEASEYIWSSSSSDIATVSQQGVVSTISSGSTQITAKTDGGLKASCYIKVSNVVATDIELSPKKVSIYIGYTHNLSYIISPDNTVDKTVTWTSSDNSVATVKDGVVTAVSAGTAQIKATSSNISVYAVCDVTVLQIYVTGVSLSSTKQAVQQGDSVSLVATVSPTYATYRDVVWSSSNPSVATVDDSGCVVSLTPGITIITVTSVDGEFSASCEVTVTEIAVTGVSLNYSSFKLLAEETRTLIATITPYNAANLSVKLYSSNPSVATIDSNFQITAVSNGTATIYVTTEDGGYTASCKVYVCSIEDFISITASYSSFIISSAGAFF